MDNIRELIAGLRTFWGSLGTGRRWTIFGVTLLILLFLGGIVVFAGKTTFVPLFSGLDISDQAAIVEYLKENGVDYRLNPGASSIMVSESRVYELRLMLASDGLPKGGTVGFEIFDKAKMGMTDFQQQVAYIRAVEGELSRTIRQLDVVESAKVSVVLHKPKLFLKEELPASASVLIKLRRGRDITREQVRAVMNLTAASVEGLDPKNVSVVDTSGRLLSDMVEDAFFMYPGSSGGISSMQRELEKLQEKDLETKIQNMLTAIFGAGNSIVRVRVELDFTRRNQTRQEYLPQPGGKGVLRSVQKAEETYSGAAEATQAVGTAVNIPGYAVQSAGGGSGEYSKTDDVSNYEISTLHQEEEETPGSVKRITASVVINKEEGSVPADQLLASLGSAIGIDESRGDRLTLNFMVFAAEAADSAAGVFPGEEGLGFAAFPWTLLLLSLGGAVLAFLGWQFVKKRRSAPKKGKNEEKSGLETPDLFKAEKGGMKLLEEQLGLYAEGNPEDVAGIIRQWLGES